MTEDKENEPNCSIFLIKIIGVILAMVMIFWDSVPFFRFRDILNIATSFGRLFTLIWLAIMLYYLYDYEKKSKERGLRVYFRYIYNESKFSFVSIVFLFILIIVSFALAWKHTSDVGDNQPTNEAPTITSPAPTIATAPPSVSTPIPTLVASVVPSIPPTSTLTTVPIEPAPTPGIYSNITVGILDNGDGNTDFSIYEKIRDLGFSVRLVKLDQENPFEGLSVLYFSKGWYSNIAYVEAKKMMVADLLKDRKFGLLIGDPGFPTEYPADPISLLLSDFIVTIRPLDEKTRDSLSQPYVKTRINSDLKCQILGNATSWPVANAELQLPEKDIFGNTPDYERIIAHRGNGLSSLVSSTYFSRSRFIIMPGSEYPSGANPISDRMTVQILTWLARSPISTVCSNK